MKYPLRLILLLLSVMALHMPAHADLTDGEITYQVQIRVQLMNGHEYPGCKFYFRREHWSEDPIDPDSVTKECLLPGHPVLAHERNPGVPLYAEDSQGNVYQSDTTLGGTVFLDYDEFQDYVQQIRVVELAKGKIKFKTVAWVEKDHHGKVLRVTKGAMATHGALGIWMIPLVSWVGLIAFFLLRRRIAGNTPAS